MRSFPATGWIVTHVDAHDHAHPGPARPARVLLEHARRPGEYLLPHHNEGTQVTGELLGDVDVTIFRPLVPQVEWRAGHVPVCGTDGRLHFVARATMDERRRQEAGRLVGEALAGEGDLSTRLGRLDMADSLLGGDVVPLAAALHVAAGDAERTARLRRRFLRAAPTGSVALEAALDHWPTLEPSVADNLRAATSRSLHEKIAEDEWSTTSDATLARWWVRYSLITEARGLTALAEGRGIPRRVLYRLLRGDVQEAADALAALPTRDEMLRDLEASAAEQGRDEQEDEASEQRRASLADAHAPRIHLFADQIARLERLTGDTSRLARWTDAAASVARVRAQVGRSNEERPFERARLAAEWLRQELYSRDPLGEVTLYGLIESIGGTAARAALATPNALGALSAAPEAGPVLVVNPDTLSNIGWLRFALAHQLGHLLDPEAHGEQPPCGAFADAALSAGGAGATPTGSVASEQFANAFACYLLAPLRSVRAMVGDLTGTAPGVLLSASADVAISFGLTLGAALAHTLNCAGVRGDDWRNARDAARVHPDWSGLVGQTAQDTEKAFEADRSYLDRALGTQRHAWTVKEALRRPRSAHFDRLLSVAETRGVLADSTIAALRSA